MDRGAAGTICANGLLLAVVLAAAVTPPVAAQCGYEISAIIQPPACPPPLNDPPATIPTSMNELGQVVGYHHRCLAAGTVPFFWSPETGLVDLAIPAGFDEGYAWDINGTGDIVGSLRMNNRYHAILWREGEVIDLGWMPGGNFSVASAVNDSGLIVGWWGNSVAGPMHAFVSQDGVMTDLGPSLGTQRSQASDVNEAGYVVGWMGTAPQIDAHAYIWFDGMVTDLGPIPGGFTSEGQAITQTRSVVGVGRLAVPDEGGVVVHAFFWNGEMTDLGTLPDFTLSAATAINTNGWLIGRSWNKGGNPNISHAFISQGSDLTDLNDLVCPHLGITITSAWAISEGGSIAARGTLPGNTVVAALLTPADPSPGDINGDCETDVADLIILLDAWGQSDSSADLNGDGIVNVLDLIILLLNLGS